ncbi:hypothetical protein FHR92_004406 [Fontibacillus solani]|uniref:Uncharacterized protein n=1 Tax=Fontibacillus solani TaxID=1572857 RepID=A0A7W3SXG1_9BACL|nr:hypothetical protein [Fontibacillus solani]MBA9087913.1 hypothetical protein [Fontibacillus solani]
MLRFSLRKFAEILYCEQKYNLISKMYMIAVGASLGGWAINISGATAAILGASILILLCAIASPAIERLRTKA